MSISKYIKYGYLLVVIPVFFLVRYYYFNDPEIAQQGTVFAVCPFHYVTGYHCPGCGSQRAIHDLLNFRLLEAIKHNILLLVVIIVFIGKGYSIISKKFFPSNYYDLNGRPWFTYSLIVLVFSYWILRNIPHVPFTFFAP
ncbi:MAG: hypothetical protein ACI828_002613 [Flavobacteriales bacterium]|jgi:hypothetical protein